MTIVDPWFAGIVIAGLVIAGFAFGCLYGRYGMAPKATYRGHVPPRPLPTCHEEEK